MPAKTILQGVLDAAGQFVVTQKGEWNHEQWEALLEKVAALGLDSSDETKRNLGNILESAKFFYGCSDCCAVGASKPKAKAAAKPKAKTKAKAKPKAKAKS